MMENEYTRLPKWARERIVDLERVLKDVTAERDALVRKSPTVVRWGYIRNGSLYGYLDPYDPIVFTLSTREDQGLTARLSEDGKGVNLIGARRITIEPEAANSCTVRLMDREK